MKQIFFILTLLSFSFTTGWAQEENTEPTILKDSIYKDYISSVRFHVIGTDLSMPIIDLNDGNLYLNFDDLDGDSKYFYYTIVHCDKNWKPSADLSEMDYIDGFTEEEIDFFEYSSNTLQPFTNYELALPNADMTWKLSGNYVLKIYTDEGADDLVLTRRFIVVDSKVSILPDVSRAFEAGKMDSHQELDFVIDHKGFPILNPKEEVSVSILQNGNWNSMMSDIKPLFIKGERLEYDYQGKIVFPGIREFRFLDLRTFRYRTDKVKGIYQSQDGTDVDLVGERIRADQPYIFEIDMNGNFIIDNHHEDEANIESDYAMVNFNLSKKYPFENGNIYIFGKMTDWDIKEDFKMEFNAEKGAYEASLYLKQGFYNYLYAFVPEDGGNISFDDTEGNTFEAENDYTIIVYHRPFGARYDQVIAVNTFNSIK